MQLKSSVIKQFVITGFALSSLTNTVAVAQLEEVLVTAQKRSESIQNVPISITAFSGEELTRRGIADAQTLAQSVINFDLPSSNATRNSTIRIRGIGSSGTNPGIESSVGTFVDGVYMPSSAMALGELSDIASYEVLRGPQGTLYGRNTPVGALNITTLKPSQDPEGKITVGYGDYEEMWVNGYVGGGLSDDSAGRLSFWYRDREGYEENLFTGDDVNDHSTWGLRGKLLFEPTENLEINLVGSYSEVEKKCCMGEQLDVFGEDGIAIPGFLAAQEAAGLPFVNFDDDDRKVDGDDEGDDQTDSLAFSAQVDWDLGNDFLFTSITAYQDWENDARVSTDSLKNEVLSTLEQIQKNEVTSQEFRLSSPADGAIEYLAGVYLYAQDTTFDSFADIGTGANRVFPLPPPLVPLCGTGATCMAKPGDSVTSLFDQETRSAAAYGNLTWHISEQWDVTGGLRWGRDEKDVFMSHTNTPGNGFVIDNLIFPANEVGDRDLAEDYTTWSLNTRYRLGEDAMLFATVSTGYKSGGFNSRRLPVGAEVEFENEDSITYEAGLKSTWLEQTLRLNATVFHTVVENFQESVLNSTGTGFIVGNAGEQTVSGFESDLTWAPIEPLTISGSLAYLDAEYTDFEGASCGLGETPDFADGSCDRTGETPSYSPEWQWTLGAEWTQPISNSDLEWRLRADYNWRDDQNLVRVSQDDFGDQDAYGLLNLRAVLAASSGGWAVEAFVNNVTDETYYIAAALQPVGALVSAGGFAGAQGGFGWYGAPRTWGVQITWFPGS